MREKAEVVNEDNFRQDSEISLVEIWLIMMKRKWIIIGTLILALLIAGLYLLSTKPIYESIAMIQIGKIGQYVQWGAEQNFISVPIEDRLALIQRLNQPYSINKETGVPFTYSIKADKQTDGQTYGQINSTVILTAQGRTAIEAQQNLTISTDALMSKHQQIYNEMKSLQQKQLELLTHQRKTTDEQGFNLEQRIINQQMIMSELYTKSTQFLLPPTLNNQPIAPQKKTVLIMAIFSGLFLGFFIVFIIEFYENNVKKRLNTQAGIN